MKKTLLITVLTAAASVLAADISIENARFRLTIGEDAVVKSLVAKEGGEELLEQGVGLPFCHAVQERPFNNEVKLSYPNSRTVYEAVKVRREGDRLVVGFRQAKYEAVIALKTTGEYIAFTLEGFRGAREPYSYMKLDVPPVSEFRILQLPVKSRRNFGQWLNVMWDDSAAVALIASSVDELISHETRPWGEILVADAYESVKREGTTAILIASKRKDFLDCVDRAEIDFDMPRGVKNRRNPDAKKSTLSIRVDPRTVDRAIALAKEGGFGNILINYSSIVKEGHSWEFCGDYDFREEYPNGFDDLRAVLARIKAAGLHPGIHFLQTHIGMRSRYVTPVADHRLGLKRHYTLARPLAAGATEMFVEEDPTKAPKFDQLRVLMFNGELIKYGGCTKERPYRFTGLDRGAFSTRIAEHPAGEIGGVLDVSEYGGTMWMGSCYLDQDSSLADEVADKIAAIYNCGFEFVYMDGSEGVKPPYGHYVARAQKRVWDRLEPKPFFAEGAAKAHYTWHMFSGANAYDQFAPPIFMRDVAIYPVEGAELMRKDFTQVDFGWWGIGLPDDHPSHKGHTPEMWEFGLSLAEKYGCPITVQARPWEDLDRHPGHVKALFSVFRKWMDRRK